MKELSIEQKAKAYDEAKMRMNAAYNSNRCTIGFMNEIFPELAKSEGERIELINYLYDVHDDDEERARWIAWLEKQVQGEQKPTMIQWKGNNLKEVIDFTGVYKEGFEKWFHNSWEEYEQYVHEHNNIFKIFNEDGSHIEVPVGAWIVKTPDGYNTASRYVFRQKPAEWSEEDERMYKAISIALSLKDAKGYLSSWYTTPEEADNWLLSIKNRVSQQPKQEWSEEDEANINRTIHFLQGGGLIREQRELLVIWLESLRPQNMWISVDEEVYVKEPVLAQKKDKSDTFRGFVVCCDHTLIPNVYERYMILGNIVSQNRWKPSDLPHWKKSNLPNDKSTGFNSDYFCYKGYGINYKELFEKLPKDD